MTTHLSDPTLKIYENLEQGTQQAIKRQCSISKCERNHYALGMCSSHYRRSKRHGDPRAEVPVQKRYYDPELGFSERVFWNGTCLEWVGRTSPDGYGKFKNRGRQISTHRYAWERVNGRVPDGMEIDHVCHNRACVNVRHLRLATRAENVRNLSGCAKDNKHSGYRNVGKMGNKWRVRVTKDGVVHYFGTYDTKDEAAEVAYRARHELFGEFAGRG